jgi:CheY-like chemotaxis protein
MKYHVLIVEDETTLLRGLLRGLRSMPQLHLTGCTHVYEAVNVLDSDPPDVLITDLNLPDRNGLELIAELQSRGLRIPVIVTTAYNTDYASELSRHPDLTLLEKPVSIQDLRRVLENKLKQAATWAPIGPFQLVDYLQLAGFGRYSVQLAVELDDRRRGFVEIVKGDIWNATLGGEEGRKALFLMLNAGIENLACRVLDATPDQRSIHSHWEEILLDLARESDERDRDGQGDETYEDLGEEDGLFFSDDFLDALQSDETLPEQDVFFQEEHSTDAGTATSEAVEPQGVWELRFVQALIRGEARQAQRSIEAETDSSGLSFEPWIQNMTQCLA